MKNQEKGWESMQVRNRDPCASGPVRWGPWALHPVALPLLLLDLNLAKLNHGPKLTEIQVSLGVPKCELFYFMDMCLLFGVNHRFRAYSVNSPGGLRLWQ